MLEPGTTRAVSRLKVVEVKVGVAVSMVTLLQRGTCFSRSAGEALPLCTTETCDTNHQSHILLNTFHSVCK